MATNYVTAGGLQKLKDELLSREVILNKLIECLQISLYRSSDILNFPHILCNVFCKDNEIL